MNYLQLCQRAGVECGISGTITSVTGNTGSAQRIVNWVGDGWNELQTKYDDWTWMRSTNIYDEGISFVTVAGQFRYPLGTGAGTVGVERADFTKWDRDSFRVETTSQGFLDETFLDYITFDAWRNSYMLGAMRQVQTRPVAIAIGPDQSLALGPPPDGTYTVTGDYFVMPSVMTTDTDEPTGLPAQYHMLIVYKAMQKYALYESAPEVLAASKAGWDPMMGQLEAVRGPDIMFAGALA